jgi:rRNA processing protein Gar1
LQKYIKLNLFFLGNSKKHHIFRAKRWDKNLEAIFHKPVYTEKYEEIGYIKEIFGPINLPFISINILPNKKFNPNDTIYAKLH